MKIAQWWIVALLLWPLSGLAQTGQEDANSLKLISVEQLEQRIRTQLKDSIVIHDYRPEPRPNEARPSPQVRSRPAMKAAAARQAQVSTTNLQELGVDEADFIKTDGRYIYAINNPTQAQSSAGVRIFDVRKAAKKPQQVASIGFKKGIELRGMYLLESQRQLIVLGSAYQYRAAPRRYHYRPSTSTTSVFTVDIANPAAPRLVRTVELDGAFFQTRRIQDRLYLVLQDSLNYESPTTYRQLQTAKPLTEAQKSFEKNQIAKQIDQWSLKSALPKYRIQASQSEGELIQEKGLYINSTFEGTPYALSMILAIDLKSPTFRFNSLGYLDWTANLYMSNKALYLSSSPYSQKPALAGSRLSSTLLHKIQLNALKLDYRGSGEVLGSLGWNELSSFQMDEDKQGNLRIVTFSSNWERTNSHPDPVTRSPVIVSVLAEQPGTKRLVTLARLPNKAQPQSLGKPGESLYGARLLNDYAYFVTFRNTDPLYVVDLRNPRQLKLSGELVIPGFSDYLHPLTAQLMLGIGKAADASQGGTVQGWKLSLFDVSHPNRPKELDSLVLGDPGSDSPANRQHHAVTTLAVNSNTLTRIALPVRVMESDGTMSNGLHRFEVQHAQRKLVHKGAFQPSVAKPADWYWNETDRSILINQALYYYRDGQLYASTW